MDTLSSSVPTFKLPILHPKPHEYHQLLKNQHILQAQLVSSTSRPRGPVVAYKSTTSFPTVRNSGTTPFVSSSRASSPLKQTPGAEFHRKAASGYAVALLDMARRNNVLQEVKRDVKRLSKWLRNGQLRSVMADPCVVVKEKGEILKEVVKRGMLHKQVVKLVNLLVGKAKLEVLGEVLMEFERIYDELSVPATAQVLLVSNGMKLEKDQILGIAERVQKISGAVNVKVRQFVDKKSPAFAM